jgi:PEP-CTERM motif
MKDPIRRLFTFLIVLTAAPLGCATSASAAAFARTDAEIALRLDGITKTGTANPATLEVSGSGTRQLGPLSPAVFDSFNRVRVSGVSNPATPVTMLAAAFPNGDKLELDGQSGVRTDTLVPGQSAELLITLTGAVDVVNSNAFDATMNIFYEREYFLDTSISDAATEQALAHGTFHILGRSFDAAGAQADEFGRDFDQALSIDGGVNPQEKFNFNFLVPAGGTARFDMTATAYSRVALVPEPASLVLLSFGLASLVRVRRLKSV